MSVLLLKTQSSFKYLSNLGLVKPFCIRKSENPNSVRLYRNISHGQRPTPFLTGFILTIFIGGFMGLFIDWKLIFGLRDKEKELEELKNYTLPDRYATYTELTAETRSKELQNKELIKKWIS